MDAPGKVIEKVRFLCFTAIVCHFYLGADRQNQFDPKIPGIMTFERSNDSNPRLTSTFVTFVCSDAAEGWKRRSSARCSRLARCRCELHKQIRRQARLNCGAWLKNELFRPDFDVMGGDCNPTSVYRSLQVAKASLLLEEHVLDGRLPVTSLVLLTHIAVRVREYSRTAPLDARLSQRDERITSK